MVRLARFIILTFILLISESALSKSAECVRAYAAIELKQAEYLANPPTKPLRTLTKEEVTITPLNGGKSFSHNYIDDFGVVQHWGPGPAVGFEVSFKTSGGQIHRIKIVGKYTRPAQIEAVTEMVLKLPAETLEATERIEVQTFVRNSTVNGYAQPKGFVLHEDGANVRTLNHEFGHNLAVYVWGRFNPYKEWEKAFKADGSKFVTRYAQDNFASTKYAEDFAEAVESYLANSDQFRKSSPNRAALLDTIFRDGDLWKPIRDHNGTTLAQISRTARENPGAAGIAAVLIAGTGAAIVEFVKLPLMPPANPR
jgi:hypothetical protein